MVGQHSPTKPNSLHSGCVKQVPSGSSWGFDVGLWIGMSAGEGVGDAVGDDVGLSVVIFMGEGVESSMGDDVG